MSMTIEVRDGKGKSISAERCQVTGSILITPSDSEPFWIDPKDPDALAWLKVVFGNNLGIIFNEKEDNKNNILK